MLMPAAPAADHPPPHPHQLLPAEELFAQIASCGGPSLNCTVTPEAVCAESGRLLGRAASPTVAGASSGDAVAAAAWTAAAAEAAAAHTDAEEEEAQAQASSVPEEGISASVGKL